MRLPYVYLEPHQPKHHVAETIQHPDNGAEYQIKKPQMQLDAQCCAYRALYSDGFGRQLAEYDVQYRDDSECHHMPKIFGYRSSKLDIEPTENRCNDIGHYVLTNPTQCQGRYRDAQLGCGQVAIEMGSDVFGHLGHLATGLYLDLDLGSPDLDNRKFGSHKKSVCKKDRKRKSSNYNHKS